MKIQLIMEGSLGSENLVKPGTVRHLIARSGTIWKNQGI